MEAHKIQAQNLVKIYGRRKVVDGLSMEMSQGEVVGILGPNGAGKTTTFYMILGLAKPNRGKVLLNGRDITHQPMYRRARLGLGYLAQAPSIFAKLSVRDNIMAILQTLKISRQERKERLESALEELNLTSLANQKAYTLSGGERRRVEIARAMALKPLYLLLDEPFAGIDPITVKDIQDMIVNLKKTGIGVIITDHNVKETLKICDRAYIIHQGLVIEEGTPEKVVENDQVKQIYVGRDFSLI